MGRLQRALSWLIVLIAGLAPILVYWLASVIRRKVRRGLTRSRPGHPQEGERALKEDGAPSDGVNLPK